MTSFFNKVHISYYSIRTNLDGFDAVILLVPPVNQPDLVQMLHVEDVDWVPVRHDNLFMKNKNIPNEESGIFKSDNAALRNLIFYN